MERLISSEIVTKGKAFTFRIDEVELASGRRTKRYIVEHPGAVAIIPVLPDGRIVLVRQYRHATGRMLLEIPAGTLEVGETPEECAKRELIEETSYEAGSMEELKRFYTAPGYSSEMIHVFVAKGLRSVKGEMEEDESIRTEIYKLDDVMRMISDNSIEDGKTICGMLAFAISR